MRETRGDIIKSTGAQLSVYSAPCESLPSAARFFSRAIGMKCAMTMLLVFLAAAMLVVASCSPVIREDLKLELVQVVSVKFVFFRMTRDSMHRFCVQFYYTLRYM